MLYDESNDGDVSDRMRRIAQMVDEVIDRRNAGEDLSDTAVTEQHSDLMPELGARLRELGRIAHAVDAADQTTPSGSPVRGPDPAPKGAANALPADSFAGYRIVREIQRGGQGVVYQAIQSATKRKVAVKVIRGGPFADPRDRARFEREVQILGKLRHPNIVTIHESGSSAGNHYFVMDYISGVPAARPSRQTVRRSPCDPAPHAGRPAPRHAHLYDRSGQSLSRPGPVRRRRTAAYGRVGESRSHPG